MDSSATERLLGLVFADMREVVPLCVKETLRLLSLEQRP